MNNDTYKKRREALREKLFREKLDGLLISHSANRFYLSGFELHDGQCNESSGYLLITHNEDYLFTDSRFFEVACTLFAKENIIIYSSAVEELRLFIKKNMGKNSKFGGKIGFESKILSQFFYENLSQGVCLEPADGLVEELRVIKDSAEIVCIEQSVQLNHAMFAWLPSILEAGLSEAKLAYAIEKYFREHGASELSFPTIVGKNQHAARPHHEPQKSSLLEENSHVLIDCGARLNHYCSDQTRTFWIGDNPDQRFIDMLEQVQEAQKAAIAILRPELSCKEAHEKAIECFQKYGVEKAFTHSLGHGVGIEVHEEPRLSLRSNRTLKPGMIVTVEPGLYYGDYGGVRWEHMVLITEDGHRVL